MYAFLSMAVLPINTKIECLSWLTQHPRTSAGIQLRRIVCDISNIKTNNDKIFWIRELDKWHDEYEDFLEEKSVNLETGELTYTHGKIRMTYAHLKRAVPNMFKFVEHPQVPKNINGLEAFFGHLKDNLSIHRGLSKEHHIDFIKWYLHFSNEKKKRGPQQSVRG